MAIHARQLALEPDLQIIRRSRRPLLPGLEQAHRSALAHHVHRIEPMGARVLINGIRYNVMLKRLRRANTARERERDPEGEAGLLYRAVELGGEAGERLNVVKKLERENGEVVGRIFKANAAPVGEPWMWTLAFGHHEDRTPTHGYAATREAAMAAFAKSWRRE